jgi:hypothetical protein
VAAYLLRLPHKLITFPITLGFYGLLFTIFERILFLKRQFILPLILAESFPFVSEYVLLKWFVGRLTKQKQLLQPITSQEVVKATCVASGITMLLGLLIVALLSIS